MSRPYPVVVHKDQQGDHGVIVPDFPGVFSGGATLAEALSNVQEALELYFEGQEEGAVLPEPSSLDVVLCSEEAQGSAVVLVDVDLAFLDKSPVAVNISLPSYLRAH